VTAIASTKLQKLLRFCQAVFQRGKSSDGTRERQQLRFPDLFEKRLERLETRHQTLAATPSCPRSVPHHYALVYKLYTVRERDRRIHRRCCKSFLVCRPLLLSQNPLSLSLSLSLAGCNNKGSGGCRLFVRACLRRNARGEGAFRSARASVDLLRLCVPGSRAVKRYGGWVRALPRVSCVGGAARPDRPR